jgi:hypothetical protein
MVLHEDGIVVETFQREGAQVMRELVSARFEFAIRSLRDVGDTSLQRPSTAIKLSTPTGEMRNSPE